MEEYKLYDGKNICSINGEEGLNAMLEMLQEKREVRIAMIHSQKFFLSYDGAVGEMRKRGYMTRVGTEEECKREDKNSTAVRNFAKLLKERFPEDWKSTVVKTYSDQILEPKI